MTLASLTLTPLRLEAVTRLDPDDPQVEVEGTAYVCDRSAWGPVPDDLPLSTVLEVYDVYGAGSLTRTLAPAHGTVCVLGAATPASWRSRPRATRWTAARWSRSTSTRRPWPA